MKAESATGRRVGIGLAAALAVLTSACAAGQQAQTANQYPTLDGTETSVGDIALRGLAIAAPTGGATVYPKGSAALIRLVIVNKGTRTDKLTAVTTSSASGWSTYPSVAQADSVLAAANSSAAPSSSAPASSSAASTSAAPTSGASTSAASTSATSSSPATPSAPATTSSAPPPQGTQSVSIPAGEAVYFGTPSAKGGLLLLQTTKQLYTGNSISITFTFARAGSVRVGVPVQLTGEANTAAVQPPSGAPTE